MTSKQRRNEGIEYDPLILDAVKASFNKHWICTVCQRRFTTIGWAARHFRNEHPLAAQHPSIYGGIVNEGWLYHRRGQAI